MTSNPRFACKVAAADGSDGLLSDNCHTDSPILPELLPIRESDFVETGYE